MQQEQREELDKLFRRKLDEMLTADRSRRWPQPRRRSKRATRKSRATKSRRNNESSQTVFITGLRAVPG